MRKLQRSIPAGVRVLKQGSMIVEAAFLIPMAVLLTGLLILYCFFEHDRVWYTAAACEAALVGTQRTERGQEAEKMAEIRVQERIKAQPFPLATPASEVACEEKSSTVSFSSSGETFLMHSFPYRVRTTVKQSDPAGRVRTAWIAKKIMNGG